MEFQSINKIELAGIIGQSRTNTYGENQMIHLSVATNYSYKSQDGSQVIETTWHNVVYWSKRGEDLSQFTKGTKVHILGRLKQSRYTTADGSERTSYEILAHSLELV